MTTTATLYERISLRCNEEEHSYLDLLGDGVVVSEGRHLLSLAEQMAAYMAVHLAGHRVVICLDQCSTFMPVFWACLRAGLTAIPVTLAASGARASGRELQELRQLLEQAGPVAIVVDELSAGLETLLGATSRVRWLPFSRLIAAAVPSQPLNQQEAAVAFALQTSGTTGECKYAAFSGDWYDYEVSNPRRVLTLFPLGSSTGIGYAYALSRLSAYLPLREAVRDPDRLFAAIEAYQIEAVIMPPVMVSVLLRYLATSSGPLTRRDLSSLIKLNIGSSTIPLEAVEQLGQLLRPWGAPDNVIHFAYGLTETGGVAYGPYRGLAEHRHPHGLRIGPVSSGVNVAIGCQDVGEPGPITVQRPFTFLGYLSTVASAGWTLSPFESGADWFETGDLGLLDDDGLVLTGRLKDTIVLNSRKTSLAAIERFVAETTPDLFDVVVACAGPGESLVLFVVLAPHAASLTLEQLQATLAQPIQREFGVPLSQLVVKEAGEIPRTATGKVRKPELVANLADLVPSPTESSPRPQVDASLEQQLFAAIRQHSAAFRSGDGHQPISSFGIDSLALAQIIGSVERSSGIRCRLEACPPDPTIHQLAELFAAPVGPVGEAEAPSQGIADLDQMMVDVRRFPLRTALAHQIQAANVQLSGEPVGPERVVRRFNSNASGVPVVLVGQLSGSMVANFAAELSDHPLYYLRVLHDYASAANQDYLACCCLDWLEACLPECNPVVVGFCLAGRLALDLSRQMWHRQRAPRLCVLMDWNVGRYSSRDAYKGTTIYHVHDCYHRGSLEKRQEIKASLVKLTPNILMAFWGANRDQSDQDYVDWPATQQILINIMRHQAVQPVLAAV